jgi:hypothetical protein
MVLGKVHFLYLTTKRDDQDVSLTVQVVSLNDGSVVMEIKPDPARGTWGPCCALEGREGNLEVPIAFLCARTQ